MASFGVDGTLHSMFRIKDLVFWWDQFKWLVVQSYSGILPV